MAIKIIQAGLFTTVQDLGRKGYESYGFSPAGAMDYKAHTLANSLVGNDSKEATLEMTLRGIEFLVTSKKTMATAGADMELTINDVPYPIGKAIDLNEGDKVVFGGVKNGARTYLAFNGGIDLERELDSYATHTRSGIGGYKGRALKAKDVLKIVGGPADGLLKEVVKEDSEPTEIRFIFGQQKDRFDKENIEKFISEEYTFTKDSDRMGARLEGEPIVAQEGHDILSEPTQFGSIQIPKNGQPIILLADRQTAGGYTKIGTVIKVDLPVIAQKKPGEKIIFRAVSIEEAENLYKESLQELDEEKDLIASNDFKTVRRIDAMSVSTLIGG